MLYLRLCAFAFIFCMCSPMIGNTVKDNSPFFWGGAGKDFGSDLLSHMTLCSIIGDGELNLRVRNGIACTLSSLAAKKYKLTGEGASSSKQDSRAISTGQRTPRDAYTSSLSTR